MIKSISIATGRGTISVAMLVAIWSISAVISLPGLAISPILGDLDKIFPKATHLEIQMLTSLPSLLIIPCVLLSGKLSESRDKLQILFTGLVLFFLSGLFCLFARSMGLLIVISCVLGIGAGLVIPLSTGLIADYFTGRYRIRQLGISSSISNVTLVLATALTGWLATIDWHYPFLVYLLPGVSLLLSRALRRHPAAPLTTLVDDSLAQDPDAQLASAPAGNSMPAGSSVPSPAADPAPIPLVEVAAKGSIPATASAKANASVAASGTDSARPLAATAPHEGGEWSLGRRLFGEGIDIAKLLAVMGLYLLATYLVLVVVFNLPFRMQHEGIDSSVGGLMISLFFLAIMTPGLFITWLIDHMRRYTLVISFLLLGAGLILILLFPNAGMTGLGAVLSGLGYGIVQPIVYDKAVMVTRPDKATFALAWVMSVNYLAILIAPFLVDFFQWLFHTRSLGSPFLFNGVAALAVALVAVRYRHSFGLGLDPAKYR